MGFCHRQAIATLSKLSALIVIGDVRPQGNRIHSSFFPAGDSRDKSAGVFRDRSLGSERTQSSFHPAAIGAHPFSDRLSN
ncbi:hypothetical protein NG799_21755 [Laspinema sp. D1]|uniref:Uncharacterized protein n=1 Tax=Laspinema palackyanum D2a TaxID=2953684 RepID=A0ABT2MY87_9CYAN|nr:hypothetical protein [Laspinema sp. D2a]